MLKAIGILIGLVGYNFAIKVWAIIKMMKIRVDNWSEEDFIKFINDPEIKKQLKNK